MTILSVPVACWQAYPNQTLVLRTADPAGAVALLGPVVPAGVLALQVTELACDLTPLVDWAEGLALDLVMADALAQLPLLYRCGALLERHPVRVSIPLAPGLARAVKLAVALGLPVQLSGQSPPPAVLEELCTALTGYLHDPTVAVPVEPFHSLLLAFLNHTPVALWSLLERDPAELCLLDEQGAPLPGQAPAPLPAVGAQCLACPWHGACGGYWKWPQGSYDCTGVQALFADLAGAADAIRTELAAFDAGQGATGHG